MRDVVLGTLYGEHCMSDVVWGTLYRGCCMDDADMRDAGMRDIV